MVQSETLGEHYSSTVIPRVTPISKISDDLLQTHGKQLSDAERSSGREGTSGCPRASQRRGAHPKNPQACRSRSVGRPKLGLGLKGPCYRPQRTESLAVHHMVYCSESAWARWSDSKFVRGKRRQAWQERRKSEIRASAKRQHPLAPARLGPGRL